MPFVLLLIAITLIVSGIRGTQNTLGKLLVADFTGSGNFIYWVASIVAVGFIGYIPELQKFSRAMIVLIIVVMVLSNKGFFAQFNNALKSGTANAPVSPPSAVPPLAGQNQDFPGILGTLLGGTDFSSGNLDTSFNNIGSSIGLLSL